MRTALLLAGMLLVQSASQTPVDQAAARKAAEDAIARDVHVTLALKDNQQEFKIGEAIRLVMTLTADRRGYFVEFADYPLERPADAIEVTPAAGVVRWIDDYAVIHPRSHDAMSLLGLEGPTQQEVVPLNYWFRFDEPGEYTIRLRTKRARREGNSILETDGLTTNAVSFRVLARSEEDEQAEVQRIKGLLAGMTDANDPRARALCDDLAFLPGAPATREKVRRLVEPGAAAPCTNARLGLHIARDREYARSLLDDALRDVTRPATVALADAAADARIWIEAPQLLTDRLRDPRATSTRVSQRSEQICDEIIQDLVTSLNDRTGASQYETASTILTLSSPRSWMAPRPRAIPPAVRSVVIDHFSEIDPALQVNLIAYQWQDVRDPALTAPIARLLEDPGVREPGSLLRALIDIAPADARPFVIAAALDPQSRVEAHHVQALPDATLAELDEPLLAQLGTALAGPDPETHGLGRTAGFLARFASRAVAPEVETMYDEHVGQLWNLTRIRLLGYLDRWNPARTRPRIDALIRNAGDDWTLGQLAQLHYEGSVAAIARERLESDDPALVRRTLDLMTAHAPKDARPLIEQRLDRWTREWPSQGALESPTGEPTPQGRLQMTLISALLSANNWRATPAEREALTKQCLTQACRRVFQR